MPRLWLAFAAVVLVLVPAVVSFQLDRTRERVDEGAIGDRLSRVPLRFGEWEARDAQEEDVSAFKDEGYPALSRRYVHAPSGRQVILIVSGGPSGPLTFHHQPQACYAAIGFGPAGDVTRQAVEAGGVAHQFSVGGFTKPSATGADNLRLYWAFSGDGRWDSPDQPRFTYAQFPLLFRLYVVTGVLDHREPLGGDACTAFLSAAVPELSRLLFQP